MNRSDQTAKRRAALWRGQAAEHLAALSLRLRGYRIVARRYRTKLGEVDIIARRGDLVAFVEVKARPDERAAIDAVDYATQKRIMDAADIWLSRQRDHAKLSQRFDIVAVIPWRWPRHFPDAF